MNIYVPRPSSVPAWDGGAGGVFLGFFLGVCLVASGSSSLELNPSFSLLLFSLLSLLESLFFKAFLCLLTSSLKSSVSVVTGFFLHVAWCLKQYNIFLDFVPNVYLPCCRKCDYLVRFLWL